MLSWSDKHINIKVNAPSLKAYKTKLKHTKKAFFSSFFYMKGSMTLEGSLVLPIFLFFIMTVMICLEVVRLQSNIMEALYLVGNRKAVHSYLEKYKNVSAENIESQIAQYLNVKKTPFIYVSNEQNGIHILDNSSINQDGLVKLESQYQIKPWIYWLPIGDVIFKDQYIGHAFVGYLGTEESNRKKLHDIYVYITKTGSRYHIDRNCTNLQIKTQAIMYNELINRRNDSGGKYYPCEKCHPVKGGQVFITSDGTCFHGRSDCSALKREVYMILLSEAKGYTPCKKCSN